VIDFAVRDHLAHQRQGFLRDRKAACGIARRKARDAQHAHRILGERRRHVAQHAPLQIRRAAERVDQRAVRVFRHRVDGQVAAAQVVLERHLRRRVERERVIAAAGLAFGPRQCVLLAGLRMQEYRKILADRLVAEAAQVVRARADDDVVAIADRQAEQAVTHRAADEIDFHGGIMLDAPARDTCSRHAQIRLTCAHCD
jgi:hypothetical protein